VNKQPLHATLRHYRIVAIAITVFFMFLTWDMWQWFKDNQSTMDEASTAGFISLALFAAGVVKWSLENITKSQERDDAH